MQAETKRAMSQGHKQAISAARRKQTANLTGKVFGRLTAIGYAGTKNYRSIWLCQCKCGKTVKVYAHSLRQGLSRSCGCLRKEAARLKATNRQQVGGRQTVEYKTYHGAKARCQNPNRPEYKNYGGRGIEFRFESFEQFFSLLGYRPSNSHSIERINKNGHYEPGNVQWALPKVQGRNKRNNRILTFNGRSLCLTEWAEMYALKTQTLDQRLRTGFCTSCAITLPRGSRCPHRPIN